MGRRERLVQVEVHHIDAKIARARDARERVHVRAVHVEVCAAFVEDRGDFRDALFKDAERARIRQHERGDIVGAVFAQVIGVDLAAVVGLDVLHFVAGNHDGRGIRAVGGIGDQHLLARVALALKVGANH